MSDKTNPKNPIENWRIEVVVDNQAALNQLNASVKSPIGLKNLLAIFGKALENSRRHLEYNHFVLLEDGTLVVRAPLAMLPDNILEIDLIEISNTSSLAVLDKELDARETRRVYHPWGLSGHIKGGGSVENIVMDERGDLYLHNRRMSWNSLKRMADNPLP